MFLLIRYNVYILTWWLNKTYIKPKFGLINFELDMANNNGEHHLFDVIWE